MANFAYIFWIYVKYTCQLDEVWVYMHLKLALNMQILCFAPDFAGAQIWRVSVGVEENSGAHLWGKQNPFEAAVCRIYRLLC